MSLTVYIPLLLAMGALVGGLSGLVGIGGGVMVIPILTFLFDFPQAKANGTSIAMLLPPIGIGAFLVYHRAGNVDLVAAACLAAGFAGGAYFGGLFAQSVPDVLLRRAFAFFLLYVSAMVLFRSDGHVRAVVYALLMVVAYAAAYGALRLVGRKWGRVPTAPELYRSVRRERVEPDYEI